MEKNKNVIVPSKVVGIFEKSKNFGFVKPDDKKNFKKDIFIPKAFSKNARNGQKVVVEIIKESIEGRKSEGKIVEILGFPDQAGIDMLSIIKQFDLPCEFSKEVINEAKSVSLEPISLKYRRDLRDQEVFTIDGEDAKDLDDAVCVKKLSDGNYELGVHIADVSHYVRENTEINKEAVNRSTSVYMLDRVIPMLPVELSNGCCSLNEGVDRYAMSCVMKINKRGDVIDADVFKSVINVTKRMNYHEVQVDIDRNNEEIVSQYDDEKKNYAKDNIAADEKYLNHLDLMAELAHILKNRRIEKGYLSLNIP
ncbi:MAG: RNB domain-containing ribonuclease, partial [Clostridiales bacterium]|nr:RNB domain-containing ribonuclease [Clostridiales bacterium]